MPSGPDKPKDSAEQAYAAAAAKAGSGKGAAPARPAPAKKPGVAKKVPAPKSPVRTPAKVASKPAKATRPAAAVSETPLAKVAEPAVPAVEPAVAEAVESVVEAPVVEAAEPVAEAVEPVTEAIEPVLPQVEPEAAPVAADVEIPAVETLAVEAPAEIAPPKPTITELKEKIMATAKTPDFTKPVTEAIGEFQDRAKAAYEKSTEALTEATEFAKGNVEAIVESGKIYAAGVQDLGKGYVDEAKSVYETLTADLKEIAAVKSPTELFQLQGKLLRRNFDSLVAASSKNTEAVLKLANDTFAPISGRVNLAAEKLSKAA